MFNRINDPCGYLLLYDRSIKALISTVRVKLLTSRDVRFAVIGEQRTSHFWEIRRREDDDTSVWYGFVEMRSSWDSRDERYKSRPISNTRIKISFHLETLGKPEMIRERDTNGNESSILLCVEGVRSFRNKNDKVRFGEEH